MPAPPPRSDPAMVRATGGVPELTAGNVAGPCRPARPSIARPRPRGGRPPSPPPSPPPRRPRPCDAAASPPGPTPPSASTGSPSTARRPRPARRARAPARSPAWTRWCTPASTWPMRRRRWAELRSSTVWHDRPGEAGWSRATGRRPTGARRRRRRTRPGRGRWPRTAAPAGPRSRAARSRPPGARPGREVLLPEQHLGARSARAAVTMPRRVRPAASAWARSVRPRPGASRQVGHPLEAGRRLGVQPPGDPPGQRASRPASTAWRMAVAICTGLRARVTAVASSTASQPSSMARRGVGGVPMPASRTIGTAADSRMMARL